MADVIGDENQKEEAVLAFGTQAAVEAVSYSRDLLEAVTVSFEEGMNNRAIDMLCQVSYTGLSTEPRRGMKKEILVPPPEVLSIVTTLTLHPNFTTRQLGNFQLDASLRASRYLRTIIRLAGATNCKLQQAWKFRRLESNLSSGDETNATRKMRNRNVAKAGAVGRKAKKKASGFDIDTTPFANLSIANEESLFSSCDDIWALVGWALVCSCCYKRRWDYWKDFLDLLIETLQSDLAERANKEMGAEVDLEGTLVHAIGFLPDLAGGAGYKRIIRAIFANGSEKSRNEWTPVFKQETKKPPKRANLNNYTNTVESELYATKKEKLEEGIKGINEDTTAYREFHERVGQGSYEDDFGVGEESDEEMFETIANRKEDKTKLETDQEALETWGGMDAIIMRQKLMCLVSAMGVARDLSNKKPSSATKPSPALSRSDRKRIKASTSFENDEGDISAVSPQTSNLPSIDGNRKCHTNIRSEELNGSTSHAILPFKIPKSSETPTRKRTSRGSFSLAATNSPLHEEPKIHQSKSIVSPAESSVLTNQNSTRSLSSLSRLLLSSPPSSPRCKAPAPLETLPLDPNNPQVSYVFAHDSNTLVCFYQEYVDHIRFLPIKQMRLFASSGAYASADPAFRVSIMTHILQKSMVWQPKRGFTSDDINDDYLRKWYLPHFARGQDVEAQVKMAVLVESLARLWHINAADKMGLLWSEEMQMAAEEGIQARREKVNVALSKRKKRTETDEELLKILNLAELKLRRLMDSAKKKTQERVEQEQLSL